MNGCCVSFRGSPGSCSISRVGAKLVDRLEKRGLVVRRRCENDRRVVYVEITDKALDILKQTDKPLADLHQKLLGHMSQKELKQLSRLLEKARESLTEEEQAA